MNWVADENIDREIVDLLRELGHVVWYVCELEPGMTDEDVLALLASKAAVLITCDKDFGELVFRQQRSVHGVLLVRLPGIPGSQKAGQVRKAVESLGEQLVGSFTVVSRRRLRMRPAIPDSPASGF